MKALINRILLTVVVLSVWTGTGLPAMCLHELHPAADTLAVIKNHPMVSGPESVLMITDRQTYIAGEHVWYSMHLSASAGRGTHRSLAGYAEILNLTGMPVSQSRILLDSGGNGSGMLTLHDTLSSGEYLLRGYTRAMIPYGPEHYFSKKIRVLNPYSNKSTFDMISLGEQDGMMLSMHAENGTPVPGEMNRIVVQATGADGKGRAVKAVIRDPEGTAYDSVTTDLTGLGSGMILIPQSGTLTAVAVIDSVPAEAQLAVIRQGAYTLALERDEGKSIRIGMKAPDRSSVATRWPLHLAVISPGRINYYKEINGPDSDAIIEIPLVNAPTGICEALLYDNGGGLLSSRLFMAVESGTGDGQSYPAQTALWKDSLEISLPDQTRYFTASLAADEGHAPDIRTRAILEPWLSATAINDPFLEPFLEGREPLSDDLLVTLNQRNVPGMTGSPARVSAETRGLAVTGTAINLDSPGQVSGMLFFINVPGKTCFLQYASSDDTGSFTFIVPARTGTGDIVVYPQDTAANIIVKVTSPFSHDYLPMHHSLAITSDVADTAALRMSINSQVMRIYGIPDTDTLQQWMDASAREHFYGSTGQHRLLSDYIPLPNMEEVFFELVTDLTLLKNRDRYSFRMYDPETGKEIRESPLMFIDGTLTTDAETFAGLPPDRVESFDVILTRYRKGSLLLPPVISVFTKSGDFRLQKLPQSALRISYLFTDLPVAFRPFPGARSRRMPVYGNTLLWSASQSAGPGKVAFFKIVTPDYDGPLRLNTVFFGDDPYPVSVSESINISGR